MASGRSHFLHVVISGLGLIVLSCAAYVGLGWMVWAHPKWVEKVVGDARTRRIYDAYGKLAAQWLLGDQDGDGTTDGFEMFHGLDHRDPRVHPLFDFDIESAPGAFAAMDATRPYGTKIRAADACDLLLPRVNERIEVQCQIYGPQPFPRRFRVKVAVPVGWMLGLPGKPMEGQILTVPVKSDGSLQFALQPTEKAGIDSASFINPRISNEVTSQTLGILAVKCVWALPGTEVEAEEVMPVEIPPDIQKKFGTLRLYRVHWAPIQTQVDALLLEARREEGGENWHPVSFRSLSETSCEIAQVSFNHYDDAFFGKLHFRIVPVRYSAP